ncbi:hypothetical protein CYMTET_56626 [Cymbomonas tetramitiformis]|uniref:Uncharacterized protein n=1 Tax=Cymbomonas tetramitiformis TaxID=36881 RepID=A0AAE0BAX9_9CHLO|nr:hypothetical protein CYMTET_56626 [Cymbomonas tetramitiformis]
MSKMVRLVQRRGTRRPLRAGELGPCGTMAHMALAPALSYLHHALAYAEPTEDKMDEAETPNLKEPAEDHVTVFEAVTTCGAFPFGWNASPRMFVKVMQVLVQSLRGPQDQGGSGDMRKLRGGSRVRWRWAPHQQAGGCGLRQSTSKEPGQFRATARNWQKLHEQPQLGAQVAASQTAVYLAVRPARLYPWEIHFILSNKRNWDTKMRTTWQARVLVGRDETPPYHPPGAVAIVPTRADQQGREARMQRTGGGGDAQPHHLEDQSMRLVRRPWALLDSHGIELQARYIRVEANSRANRLSRDEDLVDWRLKCRRFEWAERSGPSTASAPRQAVLTAGLKPLASRVTEPSMAGIYCRGTELRQACGCGSALYFISDGCGSALCFISDRGGSPDWKRAGAGRCRAQDDKQRLVLPPALATSAEAIHAVMAGVMASTPFPPT